MSEIIYRGQPLSCNERYFFEHSPYKHVSLIFTLNSKMDADAYTLIDIHTIMNDLVLRGVIDSIEFECINSFHVILGGYSDTIPYISVEVVPLESYWEGDRLIVV